MLTLPLKTLCKPSPLLHHARYEGVLGTALELRFIGDSPRAAREAEAQILSEINRLERAFSRYRPDSELNRWQRGEAEGARHQPPDMATGSGQWHLWPSRPERYGMPCTVCE